ncbi:hypothetical protein B0I33_11012 [Prauserella shujinwangii]|uniref:Terpene synthase n=1 Tax=Prauserella shujinwangii TaxID=1453103 RepID=A0A2T0LNX7_9PSEU|nr:hypothetical protein [Prauserella shujinwangii]PRX44914.1 hypothetical protein B0I33_11012 [Prauserella shujinwangii]
MPDISLPACFHLPEIPEPVPARAHPQAAELEQHTGELLTTLLQDDGTEVRLTEFLGQRTALWAALAYPDAAYDELVDICLFHHVMYLVDDLFTTAAPVRPDAARDLFRRVLGVLRGDPPPQDLPFSSALLRSSTSFREKMPAALHRRFLAAVEDMFHGHVAEYHAEEADLSDYLRRRCGPPGSLGSGSAGAKHCYALLEYGLGLDLADELTRDPALTALHDLATEHEVLFNDLFSLRKELSESSCVNSVLVVMRQSGCGLQEAVDTVADRVIRRGREFVALRARLDATAAPGTRTYLASLARLMAGNQLWSYVAPRYHGPHHVWTGNRSGPVVLDRHKTLIG